MSFPYDAATIAAEGRLSSYYNGNAYDAGSNPGGMAAGGHRTNFIPSLQDVVVVSSSTSDAAIAAGVSATNAATSETNAAASAAKLSGTSSTSVTIGTGSKSFTTQSGKFFTIGGYVNIRSAANPTINYMIGQVTAYSGTSLTVNVTLTGGSGTLSDWAIDLSSVPGQTGATGAMGVQGNTPALQWTFLSSTSDADPGNGAVLINNATYTSATFLYFDNLDVAGSSQTTFLDSLDDSTNTASRGLLFLQSVSAPGAAYALFRVTGAVTDGTGYRKVPVTPVMASSTAFTNGTAVAVTFSRAGDKGTDGAGAGDTISDISSVADGRIVVFNSTSGKHITNASFGIGTSGANVGALSTANIWTGAQSFAAISATGVDVTGTITGTSSSASALTVGRQGATNPALKVDASAGSSVTGLKITSSSAAGGLALSVITSGTNEPLLIDAAGSGVISLQSTATGAVWFPSGSSGAPAIVFNADPDSGLYLIADNNIGVSCNGAKVLDVSTTGLGVVGTHLTGNGTVSLPAHGFTSDTDCGMYRIGANNIGIAVNGAKVLDISTSGISVVGTIASPTLVTPALGTPSSGTLTSCTGLPISTGVSGLGSGVATALATFSSANIKAACTDETGSGALVFGTGPTLASPIVSGTITASADNSVNIGSTTARFHDLFLSNIFYLGKTAADTSTPGSYMVYGSTAGVTLVNAKTASGNTSSVQHWHNGGYVGGLDFDNTSTTLVTVSDMSLKEDLNLYDPGDLFDNINIYDFAWKSDKSRSIGIVAQELYDLIPQAVKIGRSFTSPDGTVAQIPWCADYTKLVPYLIAESKNQRRQIADLQSAIEKLQGG